MPTLKDIQRKISAVKKTQQITKAMNMVAASKLRGAQTAAERFRPYADKFREVLGSLASRVEPELHPFFQPRETVNAAAVLLLTADRGLCGSFNVNLAHRCQNLMNDLKARGAETLLIAAGRKGRDHFRRRQVNIIDEYRDVLNKPDMEQSRAMANQLANLYLTGEADEIYVVYTRFISLVKLEPTTMKLLPLSPEDLIGEEAEAGGAGEYLVEPSAEEVMIELLPSNIAVQIMSALLETACSEHAARMTAMDNATSNCKEMIENLTLIFNKARQAAITTELMDIVGGAEALRK